MDCNYVTISAEPKTPHFLVNTPHYSKDIENFKLKIIVPIPICSQRLSFQTFFLTHQFTLKILR